MERSERIIKNIIENITRLDKLTANQRMILDIAARKRGEWVTTAGMCNVSGFSGRGLHRSLKRLADLGYIEVRDHSRFMGRGNSHRHSFTASEELLERLDWIEKNPASQEKA